MIAFLILIASLQRFYACKQFAKVKRLYQVIVGTSLQPRNFIMHLVQGGKHQYGCTAIGLSYMTAQFNTICIRQHHIHYQEVKLCLLQYFLSTYTIACSFYNISMFLLPFTNKSCNLLFVLN